MHIKIVPCALIKTFENLGGFNLIIAPQIYIYHRNFFKHDRKSHLCTVTAHKIVSFLKNKCTKLFTIQKETWFSPPRGNW